MEGEKKTQNMDHGKKIKRKRKKKGKKASTLTKTNTEKQSYKKLSLKFRAVIKTVPQRTNDEITQSFEEQKGPYIFRDRKASILKGKPERHQSPAVGTERKP